MREVRASGLEALGLATRLLQRARVADPDAGLWEAADLQWWWRTPRSSDEVDQVFWVDGEGPAAGVVLTDWGTKGWGCDPLVAPGAAIGEIWPRALEQIDELGLHDVHTLVRDDDGELAALLRESGFAATGDCGGVTWLDAGDRPAVSPPAAGFSIVDRTRAGAPPHPMRARNGEHVEERLRQTSLYDPALDLAVETAEGEVAGYALFWFDPVTAVGLVEPMRVEDAFQRRGLARALLTEGVERLAARGARRMKVGYGTEAAKALYEGAGFRTTATDRTYRRTG